MAPIKLLRMDQLPNGDLRTWGEQAAPFPRLTSPIDRPLAGKQYDNLCGKVGMVPCP